MRKDGVSEALVRLCSELYDENYFSVKKLIVEPSGPNCEKCSLTEKDVQNLAILLTVSVLEHLGKTEDGTDTASIYIGAAESPLDITNHAFNLKAKLLEPGSELLARSVKPRP